MHGRLKVKSTIEQEAEKQKERSLKLEKYSKGKKFVFSKKDKLEYDSEALKVTEQLLVANPDALSFWNFRRSILLSMQKNIDEEAWQKILEDEITVTESCLFKNPKSYGSWHHRNWIFLNIPKPPYEEELNLCDKFIQKDERNFHVWDHRRLIVNQSKQCILKELAFTQDLIEKNFSNYSAWHYRSKLLPIIHKPAKGLSLPISEEVFIQELEKVVAAVFTDPSDQSPWFFLRWLIKKVEDYPRLVQIGVLPSCEAAKTLILVFSKIIGSINDLRIHINDKEMNLDDVKDCENACILHLTFETSLETVNVKVIHKFWFAEQEVEFQTDVLPSFKWISKELTCQKHISENTQKSLTKVMDDCVMLDELDPGNKWVLLTLVDIMSTLGVCDYQKQILHYLDNLCKVDSLRANYYTDLRSKVLCEASLIKYVEDDSNVFTLTFQGITRLTSSHYLCSAEVVDLGGNNLKSLNFLQYLKSCQQLILDGNGLIDLSPISNLKYLYKLSLNNCGLHSVEQFVPLSCLTSLQELFIENNSVGEINDIDNILKELMPTLKSIHP